MTQSLLGHENKQPMTDCDAQLASEGIIWG